MRGGKKGEPTRIREKERIWGTNEDKRGGNDWETKEDEGEGEDWGTKKDKGEGKGLRNQ